MTYHKHFKSNVAGIIWNWRWMPI